MERVPAIRLEEAVVARAIHLSKDRKLLAEVVKNSTAQRDTQTRDSGQIKRRLEQDQQRYQKMIDNLLTAMAELPASSTPKSIVLKVAELERERDQVEAKLRELQAFQGEGSPVINMEHAFRLFRLFDRNFQKCPAHQQRRALQELVRRIVIKETEICVEYYAAGAQGRASGGFLGAGRRCLGFEPD